MALWVRVRRTVDAIGSVASLLLIAGLPAFWIRSYLVSDSFRHVSADARGNIQVASFVASNRGCLNIQFNFWRFTHAFAIRDSGWRYDKGPTWPHPDLKAHPRTRVLFDTAGIQASSNWDPSLGRTRRTYWLRLPYWLLSLILLPLSIRHVARSVRQYHRLQSGHCARCGYDLRFSTERCPECGTANR